MATPASPPEHPRAVADKRAKGVLLRAIRMALQVESAAVRHNTQTFNRSRYSAFAALPDYDALKDEARRIKEDAIARLPELLIMLEDAVRRHGGEFYLARDAHDATQYVTNVCRAAGRKLVVKGKSITSEEIHLNRGLEGAGIEVAETDLAEFILQYADEQPSHIIGPAVHYSRERITQLFRRVFKTTEPLDTGEELTRFARERLRQKFLAADVGITGANFVCADSASVVLVESEANIRMTMTLPPLHIAISGVEKVIPSRAELGPFLELLARSGTGQALSCYTSIFSPPLHGSVVTDGAPPEPRAFHLVLIDNGRLRMRDDPVLREALYCMRCSACLNSCANFQTVGGHAFGGETYSGGIGGSWEAGTRTLANARFSELCTGCTRCVNQCPIRIDVPWLNTVLRQRLNQQDASPAARLAQMVAGIAREDAGAPLSKIFFGRYDFFGKWGSRLAPLMNRIQKMPLARAAMEKTVGVDRRRALPPFASLRVESQNTPNAEGRVVLFADIFTSYSSPERARAAVRVLRAAGIDVAVTEPIPDGRAALSQGLIATAREQARSAARKLVSFLNDGRDIIVVEPSVLAMFRLDLRKLLDADEAELSARLRDHTFDSVEYLWSQLQARNVNAADLFPAACCEQGTRVFYHAHCQQRTIGAAAATESLLRAAGFDVVPSSVECCGMAGSFGYKKDFYELSMAVGEDLFQQVRTAEKDGARILVATGTSCQEQLHGGMLRTVLHPMQLLASTLC